MVGASIRPCFSRVGRRRTGTRAFAKRTSSSARSLPVSISRSAPSVRSASRWSRLDHAGRAAAPRARASPICSRRASASAIAIEPLTLRRLLGQDAEAVHSVQQDVVAAIGEALGLATKPAQPTSKTGGSPAMLVRVLRPHRHHPDASVARERVGGHLAIARLEDVERNAHASGRARRSRAETAGSGRFGRATLAQLTCAPGPRRDPAPAWMRVLRSELLDRSDRDASAIAQRSGSATARSRRSGPHVRRRYGVCYADGTIRIRLAPRRNGRAAALLEPREHALPRARAPAPFQPRPALPRVQPADPRVGAPGRDLPTAERSSGARRRPASASGRAAYRPSAARAGAAQLSRLGSGSSGR